MTATPMKRSASLLSATTLCVTSLVVKPACVSLLAFATLQGCSMFSRSSVPGAKFLIDPPAMTPVEGAKIENILVRRFSVVPPANGLTFVYLLADGSWRTDEYNGWIADPADMFSDALATALTECGRVGMVGVEGVTVRFDFVAEGVVENLYADYSDPSKPTANVDIRIYLLDRRNMVLALRRSLPMARRKSRRHSLSPRAPRSPKRLRRCPRTLRRQSRRALCMFSRKKWADSTRAIA